MLNIERLLWIAEMYVLNVEETHTSPRTILPHGASFQGYQVNLYITCDGPKQEFMLVVSDQFYSENDISKKSQLVLLTTWYGKTRKDALLISKFQLVLHAKSLVSVKFCVLV